MQRVFETRTPFGPVEWYKDTKRQRANPPARACSHSNVGRRLALIRSVLLKRREAVWLDRFECDVSTNGTFQRSKGLLELRSLAFEHELDLENFLEVAEQLLKSTRPTW